MFPLYCNQCFRQQKHEPTMQLFVSRCGHILCNKCAQENCSVCERPFKAVPINKEMPTSMAQYFSSPIKEYLHYKKVMRFHHEQERRLVMHMSRTNAEEEKKVKNEIQGYVKLDDSIRRQIEREREKIRKLRDYTAYYDRHLEQARYMTPPIAAQPRPRYPSQFLGVESAANKPVSPNIPKRFSQTIRPNLIFPQTPSLSGTNNSSSVTTEETTVVNPATKNRRNPPPLLSFSQHKLLNQEFPFKN